MDKDRFDALTRRLGALRSRRAALGLLGAGMLAATIPADETLAACVGNGGACRKKTDCCSKRCHIGIGKNRGHCRCSKAGARCTIDADCCPNKGLSCDLGSGTCLQHLSDRARKQDVASVDPADMLARVAALPVATWSYTFDDPAVRHIGPMAQDFAALFGVGADDRHIHPVDGQGVALAAIQGLSAEVQRLQAEQAALRERIAELEAERG